MQKLALIVLALWLCPGSRAQSGDIIRVGMFGLGNAPHQNAVTSACWDELGAVNRIKLVDTSGPAPYEYAILLATSETESGSAVAISAYVMERIEPGLADRFYIKGNAKENLPAGKILNLLSPFGQLESQVGPPESIRQMCRTIVHLIDVGTFTKERQHPRGGSFDNMYESFLIRLGALRIQK